MSANTPRRAPSNVTASKTAAKKHARASQPALPSLKGAMARLDKLTADAMPWFSKDIHLMLPDGGQELIGPLDNETVGSEQKSSAKNTSRTAFSSARKAAAVYAARAEAVTAAIKRVAKPAAKHTSTRASKGTLTRT
jgi:hypothetical protein